MVEYPRWLHHKTLEPVIARNGDEGAIMLASGWALSPADFVGCHEESGPIIQEDGPGPRTTRRPGRPKKVNT
jgi:hypothetical protein